MLAGAQRAREHVEVANSAVVKEHLPALVELAGMIGDPAVRHRGTLAACEAERSQIDDARATLAESRRAQPVVVAAERVAEVAAKKALASERHEELSRKVRDCFDLIDRPCPSFEPGAVSREVTELKASVDNDDQLVRAVAAQDAIVQTKGDELQSVTKQLDDEGAALTVASDRVEALRTEEADLTRESGAVGSFAEIAEAVLTRPLTTLTDAVGRIAKGDFSARVPVSGGGEVGALAAALKADLCQIYTDVDGVYTTDPRVVTDARRLKTITFEEMLEMASLGSKVLQIRSVEFAGNYRMPTRVLSSLTDPLMPLEEEAASGTLISFEEDTNMEQATVTGIAFNRDEAKITVLCVPDRPGIAYQILGPVADANIEVDMIIQNQSVEGKTDFTFTVPRADYNKAMQVLQESVREHVGATNIVGDSKVSKVSVVGVGMRSHVGVASKMFASLSEEGINIQMISTSEIKTSVVIDEKYMELAVRALHKAFELEQSTA